MIPENTNAPLKADCNPRLVRRGPVETTTGMIRVKVYVQQDTEDRWIAKVHGSSPISYAGQTRKEAIQLALKGASVRADQPGRICCKKCGEPGGRFKATGLCYDCMYQPNNQAQSSAGLTDATCLE